MSAKDFAGTQGPIRTSPYPEPHGQVASGWMTGRSIETGIDREEFGPRADCRRKIIAPSAIRSGWSAHIPNSRWPHTGAYRLAKGRGNTADACFAASTSALASQSAVKRRQAGLVMK